MVNYAKEDYSDCQIKVKGQIRHHPQIQLSAQICWLDNKKTLQLFLSVLHFRRFLPPSFIAPVWSQSKTLFSVFPCCTSAQHSLGLRRQGKVREGIGGTATDSLISGA